MTAPRRFKQCFVDLPRLYIDSRRPGYCLRFMRTSQVNASSLQMVMFVSVKYDIRCSPEKQTQILLFLTCSKDVF